jgi:hypothetical protein
MLAFRTGFSENAASMALLAAAIIRGATIRKFRQFNKITYDAFLQYTFDVYTIRLDANRWWVWSFPSLLYKTSARKQRLLHEIEFISFFLPFIGLDSVEV